MKFEKIIIPPGWQESFTKYPNGRTIFEALSHTITEVNEGIEEVNQKVNQGLLDIEQAENTIRNEITDSFNTLKLELKSEIGDLSGDLLSQWASFQLSVNAQLAETAGRIDNIITTPLEGVSVQEILDARDGELSLGAKIRNVESSNVKRLHALDAYNNFFKGLGFVVGQGTGYTSTTAQVIAGVNILPLASVAGLLPGVVLVTKKGTAQQQLLSVVSVSGNNVTVSPSVAYAIGNGEVVTPLWGNSSHLTANGYDAWAYFIANAKDEKGNDIITGTAPKITLLCDSWGANDTALYDAMLEKIQGATVVNASVSGNTSTAMLARFDADVPADSDYVIFNEPGVNDVYALLSSQAYARNLELLVSKIRSIGAIPIFTGIPPLTDHPNIALARNNELMSQIGDGRTYPSLPANAVVLPATPEINSFGIGGNNLRQRTTGTKNTAVGVNALKDITTGLSNVGFGYNAGSKVTTGNQNMAMGDQSLVNNVAGSDNIAIGQGSLFRETGSANVAVGTNALFDATSAQYNVAIGKDAGYQPGGVAADALTTGVNNTFIGYQSGGKPTVNNAIAIGYRARANNPNSIAIGTLVAVSHDGAVAIGRDSNNTNAIAEASDEFILGTPSHKVKVKGTLNVARKTPTSSADAQGVIGDITSDDDYIYVKTSTGWKRSALTAW